MTETFKPMPIITNILKPLGYARDGHYWVKTLETHFVYLDLYASSYGGGDKYIDVRASFKRFMDAKMLYKRDWHVSERIHETTQLNGALTYVHEFKNLDDTERALRLETGLRQFALPMLENFQTTEGIVQTWFKEPISTAPELREWLGFAGKKSEWMIRDEQRRANKPKFDSLGFHTY